MPVYENERGTYIFNSKDLCMIEHIPELIEAGIDSFKIEGRMKSVHYVASVVRAYRLALDSYFAAPEKFSVQPEWLAELEKVSHRDYTGGFFCGAPGAEGQVYGTSSYSQKADFLGVVLSYNDGWALVEQRNHLRLGEEIEVVQPQGGIFSQKVTDLQDERGNALVAVPHPKQHFRLRLEKPAVRYAMLRRLKK